jgi:arylsulfatase A-like enzyme
MPKASRRQFLKTLGLGAAAWAAPRLASSPARRRPNVLFILIDDLGWMDSSVYGSRYYETPHLQRLAQRSVVFTNAYAASPFCSPTRASILTGKYPARLGFTLPEGHLPPLPPEEPLFPEKAAPHEPMLLPRSKRFLPLEEYTLAEALRDAGYRTAFIGKWHLGQPEAYWPPAHGFEVNIGGGSWPSPPSYFSPYHITTLPDGPPGEYLTNRLTDEAIRYLEQHRHEPFFLCLWHYAVHAPFQAEEKLIQQFQGKRDPRGKQGNPIMAAMIKSVDDSLGRLLDALDRLALADHTIIFFTSDNGGNEYDRVGPEQMLPTNNDPLRSGKGSLYEGGVRVPLLICWPGVAPAGARCQAVVSSIDFYPTILEMVGLAPPPANTVDGESLVPLLRGTGKLRRQAIFCHFPHRAQPPTGLLTQPGTFVRRGDWKLIRFYVTSEEFPNRYELYNLRQDLSESRNLAAHRPDLVRELDALIDAFLAETGAAVPRPNPAYDPAALPIVDGWRPSAQCKLTRADGLLRLESLGGDPFIFTSEVPPASGALVVKLRLRSTSQGLAQLFWTDAQHPRFGPAARLDLAVQHDGAWHEYEISFTAQGGLRQLRFDPCTAPGLVELDWIHLCTKDGQLLKSWDF